MNAMTFVICIVVALIAAAISWVAATIYRKNVAEKTIGSAEEKARDIIDDALKVAETKKREALLEAKEESMNRKNELDKETRERRAELQKYERRVLAKEEAIEKKSDALERRESNLASKEEELKIKSVEIEEIHEKKVQELERISGLTSEQAKYYLLKTVEDEVKSDTARLYKELESRRRKFYCHCFHLPRR